LEDMLAELEGTGPSGGYSNNKKYEDDDDLDDVDGFMAKLELESQQRNSSKPPVVVQQPVVQQPKPVVQQPVVQQPKPVINKAGGDLGGGRLPGFGLSGDSVGEKLLVAENFIRHNNKGKFVNYRNGKATDFRIKGTTSSKVGLLHVITLRALDDYGVLAQITEVQPKDFIAVILTHRETGKDLQPWFKDNEDGTYDLAFYNEIGGTVRMEIKLCGNPMFDLDIQVDETGDSLWTALGESTCDPNQLYRVDIVTADGTRPDGVAPFEVQTMGDVSELTLVNNGDGTYFCQCVPHSVGHVTIQITLHGEPIRNSPLTIQVGEKQKYGIRQVSAPQSNNKPAPIQQAPRQQQPEPMRGNDNVRGSTRNVEVTNDDLNALLDELGGF